MPIGKARFDNGLKFIIDRFKKDRNKIYFAMICQIIFFIIIFSLGTYTTVNVEELFNKLSILGIGGVGVIADWSHLKNSIKDAFTDLRTLNGITSRLEAIDTLITLSADQNLERTKFAKFLRETLIKSLRGGDLATLSNEINGIF